MHPKALIDYLVYFHCERDYFECHEVLEEYWKENGQNDPVWVGLIQLAVSMYHHRRNNYSGAKKQLKKAIEILSNEKAKLVSLGISADKLLEIIEVKMTEIDNNKPYVPIILPIESNALLNECLLRAKQKGEVWGQNKQFIDEAIVHKHKLRDRSLIIKERKNQLLKKRGN